MEYKVTVVGGKAKASSEDAPSAGDSPGMSMPLTTVSPGVEHKAPQQRVNEMPVTSVRSSNAATLVGAPADKQRAPIQFGEPSSVTGAVVRGVRASAEELARRFPKASTEIVAGAVALLRGIDPSSMTSVDWLDFGIARQESANALIKQRLESAGLGSTREAVALLRRLLELLADVTDAMHGGFLRKPPHTVWANHEPEVQQIEQRLESGVKELTTSISAARDLQIRCATAQAELEIPIIAGEYLLDKIASDDEHLLQSRLTSLAGTQALMKENVLAIEADETRLQELVQLVQDSVLLGLHSVYSQLSSLPDRPTETQKFLAMEKLTDLTQLIERKQTAWRSN
ncbi:hypothetical protein [Burkholderia sp. Ac-20365]|uniref:hypothetical protein n=1 Tax=Burkholderia sp. Ac-20365 TaxID=2703897 RepID=UPI00197B3B96|nr:hypothetical protein [Burkholderia sp. Ac-20365]MBN3761330.1 hypothetical protein [Burkholderia sp. Ac-20365]